MDPAISEIDRTGQRLLVLASDATRGRFLVHVARSLGARVEQPVALTVAAEQLDRQVGLDGLIVDFSNDSGIADTELAQFVAAITRQVDLALIVCCQFEAIDRIESLFAATSAVILVDPDEADVVAALAVTLHRPATPRSVHEVDPLRLRRLADDVARVARALANLSADAFAERAPLRLGENEHGFSAEPSDLAEAAMPSADVVRTVIRLRRLRDAYFDNGLFADPAWDMLLDLLAAHIEGDPVSVSSLCIAAAVPPTTALRWIRTMTDQGLLERHADPDDGRRFYVRLSQSSRLALARYFQAVQRAGSVAI